MSKNATKFYYVFGPHFGKPTVKHDSFTSAVIEANRLSCENVGKKYYVLEAKACLVKEKVKIKEQTIIYV